MNSYNNFNTSINTNRLFEKSQAGIQKNCKNKDIQILLSNEKYKRSKKREIKMSRQEIYTVNNPLHSLVSNNIATFFRGLNRADLHVVNELIWYLHVLGDDCPTRDDLAKRLGLCRECRFLSKKDLHNRKQCDDCYSNERTPQRVGEILNDLCDLGIAKKIYRDYSSSEMSLDPIFSLPDTQFLLHELLPNIIKIPFCASILTSAPRAACETNTLPNTSTVSLNLYCDSRTKKETYVEMSKLHCVDTGGNISKDIDDNCIQVESNNEEPPQKSSRQLYEESQYLMREAEKRQRRNERRNQLKYKETHFLHSDAHHDDDSNW